MEQKLIFADARIDESTWALTQLLEEGYNQVRWIINSFDTSSPICQQLHGTVWGLEDFLAQTEYDAPIFSKSHVNCLCHLEVMNSEGVIVRVNWSGVI